MRIYGAMERCIIMKHICGKQRNLFVWNVVLFFFITVISLFSLLFTRRILMENARKMGKEIVSSYSSEEERNLETYKNLISFGTAYVERFVSQGEEDAYIREWIEDYYNMVMETAGTETIDLYAVMGDKVYAWGAKNGREYDVSQAIWYEEALAAEGEVFYTDFYFSDIYQRPVISIAEECGDTGMVLAFVVFPENFRVHSNSKLLPEGSSYFMCDSEGVILYSETDLELEEDEQGRSYFQDIYCSIDPEKEEGAIDVYYCDSMGRKTAVFYQEVKNGWFSILTVPKSYMSGYWKIILGIYIAMCIVFSVVIVLTRVKESRSFWKEKRVNETVHMLGHSYYALYRINIKNATYEMVKASDYVRERLPEHGAYHELLRAFRGVIAEDMYDEFVKNFSIENMKAQIERNVKNYGGDFQRLFNGERKWVNVRMLFAPSFSKDEVVLCFQQVEEEKQRQMERMALLEQAVEMAHASERSQKQFFSSMSHDMRTPLNVIIGMSELAEQHVEDTEKVTDYLQKINMSSRQLLGLINDILEMSRLEQGIKLDSGDFNLREALEEALNVFRIQAGEQGKKFLSSCEIAHEQVRGDVLRLNQILNNLLSNALKFTEPGESIEVLVREISEGEHAKYQIVVKDTGRGMTEEFLQQVFVPYAREKRYGSQSVEGTGLGMPIVKNIVTLMGGEITVESVLNEGTVFTVTLPFETREVQKEKKEDNGSELKETVDNLLEGRRILLADDYELNMELATDILEMNGAEVLKARDGKEALELFESSEEFSVDAILMDMQMPVMDGCEATKKIRCLKRADAKSVPIIALTANAFSEDISRTLKAGMNAHITKPIDVKILCETLQKWMKEERKTS